MTQKGNDRVFSKGLWNSGGASGDKKEDAQYFKEAPVLNDIEEGKDRSRDVEGLGNSEGQGKFNAPPPKQDRSKPPSNPISSPFQKSTPHHSNPIHQALEQKNAVKNDLEQQHNQGRPRVTFDPDTDQGFQNQKANQAPRMSNQQSVNSLEGKTSSMLEQEPLYKRGSSKREVSQNLADMPIDYYQDDNKGGNGYQKSKKEKDLEDTLSQNSSDNEENRGVFYPNPIEDMEDAKIQRRLYKNRFGINPDSLFLFIFFVVAFIFYIVMRIKFSLGLGNYVGYGWLMLVLEIAGGVSVLQFSFTASFHPVGNKIKWDPGDALTRTDRKYHLRVIIPCYKENLEIVSHTVMACYYAPIPVNCRKTIYLLDDGNDVSKEKWVQSINSDNIVYLSHRQKKQVQMKDRRGRPQLKPNGQPLLQNAEANGKSENINNGLKNYIYKDLKPEDIPLNEIVCIMDADQVACRAFFMRMLPLYDAGDNIAMVFSPQCFYNTPPYSDIFNHSNIHFWEYLLPGADAIQVLYCPGTNILIRSQALCQAGYFPTNTVTEDFVLGMKLTANQWKFRYVREYLAVGEAPETLLQCLQQKSRWTKGHWQVVFNYKESPFTIKGLNLLQRVVYVFTYFNYIATVLNAFFFFLVPVIAIWFGIFPLIINEKVAIAMSVYYVALLLIKYYTRTPRMFLQCSFANIAVFTLVFTYMKATINGAWASATGKLKSFKVTEKKDTSKKASAEKRSQFFQNIRLIWPYWIFFYVQLLSLLFALVWVIILYHTEASQSLNMTLAGAPTELALSIVWIAYNFLPYYLVIHFTYFGPGPGLNVMCFITIAVQIAAYLAVVVVVWVLLSIQYPYGKLLDDSFYYLETQRAGFLSNNTIPTRVPWRSDSTIYDGQDVNLDLTGGIYAGGQYGFIKATLPIAFTSTMIAWSMDKFGESYIRSNNVNNALNQIKWNNDYLSKTVLINSQMQPYAIVAQVGKASSENSYWGRPENEDQGRPVYTFSGREGAIDIAAQITAAFASSYKILKYSQPGQANIYMQQARSLYQYMNASQTAPLYNTKNSNTVNLVYTQNTTYDDFMWASAWMFEAFEEPQFLTDFMNFRQLYLNKEYDPAAYYLSWDFVFWGADTLVKMNSQAQKMLTSQQRAQIDLDLKNFWYKQVCNHYNQYLLLGFMNLNDTQSNQNPQWPRKLGTLANDAFLATLQASYVSNPTQAITYYCWAETTVRSFLGDNTLKRNFVGGYNNTNKVNMRRQWDRASSCTAPPEVCSRLHNQFNTNPNPHELKGALAFQFGFFDDRTNPSNLVSIENNVGYTALLAGVSGTQFNWNQCWRIQSIRFRKNPICGNYGYTSLKTGQNGPADATNQ